MPQRSLLPSDASRREDEPLLSHLRLRHVRPRDLDSRGAPMTDPCRPGASWWCGAAAPLLCRLGNIVAWSGIHAQARRIVRERRAKERGRQETRTSDGRTYRVESAVMRSSLLSVIPRSGCSWLAALKMARPSCALNARASTRSMAPLSALHSAM